MNNPLFNSGHTACAGCGQSLAARLVLEASGANTIVCNNTGCLEVFSTKYPETAWNVPFIHSLFENAPAVASGVERALVHLGKKEGINIIAQGGDGSSSDIGLQALSGMLERGHDILYVCYDNEAYMNTGVQRSGLTPFDTNTTTTPAVAGKSSGNLRPKKPMPEIALAHGIPYVATASVGFPQDITRKVKKAMSIKGPKYMQIHVPCPLGWRHETSQTFNVGKLAVETGLYPIFEYENGKLIARQIQPKPVEEYLKTQGRFKHLLNNPEAIAQIQAIANSNILKYNLKIQA